MRLQLHALAYYLANFLRTLALPEEVEQLLYEDAVDIAAWLSGLGLAAIGDARELVTIPRQQGRAGQTTAGAQ